MGDRVAVMQGRQPAAGRHPAGPLRPPRQPLRGRLHRLARHEPVRRHRSARARGRSSSAPRRSTCPTPSRAKRPGLRAFTRQGCRGRHASRAPARGSLRRAPAPSSTGDVDLVEALGSELVVHFTIDAHRVIAEGAVDKDEAAAVKSGEGVARRRGQDPGQARRPDDLRGRHRGHAVLRPTDRTGHQGLGGTCLTRRFPGIRVRARRGGTAPSSTSCTCGPGGTATTTGTATCAASSSGSITWPGSGWTPSGCLPPCPPRTWTGATTSVTTPASTPSWARWPTWTS